MNYKKILPAANTLEVLASLEAIDIPGLHNTAAAKFNLKQAILQREREGLQKYGHTMDRPDFATEKWFKELLQELLDASQYANRAGLKAVKKDILKIAVIVENMRQNL